MMMMMMKGITNDKCDDDDYDKDKSNDDDEGIHITMTNVMMMIMIKTNVRLLAARPGDCSNQRSKYTHHTHQAKHNRHHGHHHHHHTQSSRLNLRLKQLENSRASKFKQTCGF